MKKDFRILQCTVFIALATPLLGWGQSDGWISYGGDPGGNRYVQHTNINPGNVSQLAPAWTYRTGELGADAASGGQLTFEATPVFFENRLYLPTSYGKIIALDPESGEEVWTFDAGVNRDRRYSEVTSRGVSIWVDESLDEAARDTTSCATTIFAGTIDARLIALDAKNGQTCSAFGDNGVVDLNPGFNRFPEDPAQDYQITSPPAVVNGVVIVGSSIGDNWNLDTGRGAVRAFDARKGTLLWTWDPIPYEEGKVGAANAWAPMAVDAERDLVFVPTSSPSPDFYGAERPDDNRHANSVVALKGATGELVWAFQTVHHDLWDYDLAAQPNLIELERNGQMVPAVVQPTKMGFLFVLHRETGEPLFPVEEVAVPASTIEGEYSSSTQPIPTLPEHLMPIEPISEEAAWGPMGIGKLSCKRKMDGMLSEGIFTPPSMQGTLMDPGNASGINWGSSSYDSNRKLLIVNTNRFVSMVRLYPEEEIEEQAVIAREEDAEIGRQRGAPLFMKRFAVLTSRFGLPCTRPPWGHLAAVDMDSGKIAWRVPLGKLFGIKGVPNMGGSFTTSSGLIFIGATMDNRFRAFETDTGEVLWETKLPAAGISTPMSYVFNGKQYVVIAAGGHGKIGLDAGDYVMAFSLPD